MKTTASLIVVALCAVLFFNGVTKNGFKPGDTASDFSLKNTDGKMVSLAGYTEAKGFIVVFDCNTCPYSKAYNSRIILLNKKYTPLGFPLIAINSNDPEASPHDSYDDMVKEAKKKNYSFPYLQDVSQNVAKAYGATNTPHVYILTKSEGKLIVAYVGAIDDNARDAAGVKKKYVEDAVDALLANKTVAVKQTRAIGCGIKWKRS